MKTPKAGLIESNFKRTRTAPLVVPQTRRMVDLRGMTSLPAGKMVPINFFPLLRGDGLRRCKMRLSFEMMETAEILMNAVNVNVKSYFVPWLAMARFEGSMDQFNRSYMGQPQIDGGDVIPFFETHTKGAYGAEEIYKYVGRSIKPGSEVNTMVREAYNMVWNFRARNRSAEISEVALTNTDLLPAFWLHRQFQHLVPHFDTDLIDGEVALNVTDAELIVRNIGVENSVTYLGSGITVRKPGGTTETSSATAGERYMQSSKMLWKEDPDNVGFPKLIAEMNANGITISLSNIEQAKKAAAFARIKEQYSGLEDDFIIDMLMDGLTVPDQALKQPILLADRIATFGMQKRYATDGGNLAESAVNGGTFVDLNLRLPKMETGGIVLTVAEITPEQLFERQRDPFLAISDVEELPRFLRDDLDTQKIALVTNGEIDVDHDNPDDTFGYAPLGWQWNTQIPFIGGKFYRPDGSATFDEDRQRLWVVETENPTFSSDFYLAENIHQNVFADTVNDPFECVTVGMAEVVGNTVFGAALHEATTDYEDVMAVAPTEKLVSE